MPLSINCQATVSIIVFCVVVSGSRADDGDPSSPNRFVDPFISTGGNRYVCGNNSPGATVPFGLVRLSPDLTQKWVRWILKHKYGDGPNGLDGNDDGGTLSAWYVLSSLGFYPVVGTDRYELGSPVWQRAVVSIGDRKLEIIAQNHSPDRVYVTRVELNGTPLGRSSFAHHEISGGGTLRFVMSDEPGEP